MPCPPHEACYENPDSLLPEALVIKKKKIEE